MVLDKQQMYNYIVINQDIHFEWDDTKNTLNKTKHGITFEEAATVFLDKMYLEIADPDHSQDEERFVALGISTSCRLLVVCYSALQDDNILRIISARKANATEIKQYGEKTNARRI